MGLFNLFNNKPKGIQSDNGLNQTYFCGYLESEFYRKNGELDGLHKEFFKNGNIKKQTDYKNGERIGKILSFYENGKIKNENNLEKDSNITFYDNGQIASETYSKNVFNEYNRDGSVKFKLKDGNYTFFVQNKKKLKVSLNLNANFKEVSEYSPKGIWTAYRDDESVEYTINFESPISVKTTESGVLHTYEKIIYTKAGEVYSKTTIRKPKLISESLYKFLPKYSRYRIFANDQIIIPAPFQGPPGDFNTYINNTPIISIEDIIYQD